MIYGAGWGQAVNAANARTLPIMLATKALPEMEADERELLRRQAATAQGTPLGTQYEKLGVSNQPHPSSQAQTCRNTPTFG